MLNRQAKISHIAHRDIQILRRVQRKHPICIYPNQSPSYDEEFSIENKMNDIKNNIMTIIEDMKVETPLTQRIDELREIAKATYPETPEWYILLAIEAYIKNHEPDLLAYAEDMPTEEELKNKPEVIVKE